MVLSAGMGFSSRASSDTFNSTPLLLQRQMLGQLRYFLAVHYSWPNLRRIGGEPFLPVEHRAGSHHQAESDASGRVQPLHAGCESHPHPHPSAGYSVCPATLQARRPLGV